MVTQNTLGSNLLPPAGSLGSDFHWSLADQGVVKFFFKEWKYFIITGLVLVFGLAGTLVWGRYEARVNRDLARLNQLQALTGFLKNYQSEFARLPQFTRWSEVMAADKGLINVQDPQAPVKFYVYCPRENGYVLAGLLEHPLTVYADQNLAQTAVLGSCLTSTGVQLKSLRCSTVGVRGEINGQSGQVLCLGG